MSDPIADLLTRIRNASKAQKKYTLVPHSKIKEQILKILHDKGFINSYKLIKEDPRSYLKVALKYDQNRDPIIKKLIRKSKPGLRKYIGVNEVPRVLGGIGISILSTSRGIMDGEEAKKKNVGGELLCYAW